MCGVLPGFIPLYKCLLVWGGKLDNSNFIYRMTLDTIKSVIGWFYNVNWITISVGCNKRVVNALYNLSLYYGSLEREFDIK